MRTKKKTILLPSVVKRLAERTGYSPESISDVLDEFELIILDELKEGNNIEGILGVYTTRKVKERKRCVPGVGTVIVPAHWKIYFKPNKTSKQNFLVKAKKEKEEK